MTDKKKTKPDAASSESGRADELLTLIEATVARDQEKLKEIRARNDPEEIKAWQEYKKIQFAQFHLAGIERAYNAGVEISLMTAIEVCATNGLPMPDWLAQAFLSRWGKLKSYKVKTLDEAFGSYSPSNTKLPALRDRHNRAASVYQRVLTLNILGEPLDEQLFEKVGGEFCMSMSRARKWFYWYKKHGGIVPWDVFMNSWKADPE